VEEFEKIEGDHGTRIVIMNLKKNMSGKQYEFNFDLDEYDIQLAEERDDYDFDTKKKKTQKGTASIPPDEYSLRAYFRILYMNPRMKMYIRGKKVLTKRMLHSLYSTKELVYRPQMRDKGNAKVEARVVFSFTKEHKEHYGIMYYHKNRLISRYHKIGIMNTHGSRGVGVVGIIDCYFLTPTHNKQDFVHGDRYRVMVDTLKEKLRMYWLSCNIDANQGGEGIRQFWFDLEKVKNSGPFWIQCDNCLAWRRVRKPPESYPSTWVCNDNTDKKYSGCSVSEEPDTGFPIVKKITKAKENEIDEGDGDWESPKGKSKKKEVDDKKTKGNPKNKSTSVEPKKSVQKQTPIPKRRKRSSVKNYTSSRSSPLQNPVDAIPVSIENGEEPILEDSIDDSLLETEDTDIKSLQKKTDQETRKRKATDTPQDTMQEPVSKKPKKTPEPPPQNETNPPVSDTSTNDTNKLLSILSTLCNGIAKQFSISNQEKFETFGTKEWLSFDSDKFVMELSNTVRKREKENNVTKEMKEETLKKEKGGETLENFFNFL